MFIFITIGHVARVYSGIRLDGREVVTSLKRHEDDAVACDDVVVVV
jgi:hypothetical protein